MTCVITSATATSPVWRAKCPQTSSWTTGRAAPSPTWRTSLDPVPVCRSRWDELPKYSMRQHCRRDSTYQPVRLHPLDIWIMTMCSLTCWEFPSLYRQPSSLSLSLQNASWLREPDECATTPLGTPGTCGLPSLSTADNCSDTGTHTHTHTVKILCGCMQGNKGVHVYNSHIYEKQHSYTVYYSFILFCKFYKKNWKMLLLFDSKMVKRNIIININKMSAKT